MDALAPEVHTVTAGRRRFLIAGGGTGGHVTPALALAEELSAGGDDVLMLGSSRGLERRLVPAAGFELVALPSRQFMGKSLWHRAGAALGLLATTRAAFGVLRRYDPHLVISVGGYAAAPAVLASALRRIPLAVVNPDAIPGRVNRYSARLATRVFAGIEGTTSSFPVPAERVRCLGVPLRRGLVEGFAVSAARRRPERPFRLLVFGGSQGARQLNRGMAEAIAELEDVPLEIFHQSGEADRAEVEEAYAATGVKAEVVAFEPDMASRYRWADLALCRAGAITVAELALVGLPAILVPLAIAADDHQSANARALEAVGAARRLDPRTLTPKDLANALRSIFADPDRLVAMGRAAAGLARPLAASDIATECRALARAGESGPANEERLER
jgi:UDP-N-acetylglucosamine--N-acetylmuramyl-(pentapeptide) pyrophosphoryl-undecaprenol N-acetylglucosamine transferase